MALTSAERHKRWRERLKAQAAAGADAPALAGRLQTLQREVARLLAEVHARDEALAVCEEVIAVCGEAAHACQTVRDDASLKRAHRAAGKALILISGIKPLSA